MGSGCDSKIWQLRGDHGRQGLALILSGGLLSRVWDTKTAAGSAEDHSPSVIQIDRMPISLFLPGVQG